MHTFRFLGQIASQKLNLVLSSHLYFLLFKEHGQMPVARNDAKTCIRAPNSCGEGISGESKGKLVAHFDKMHFRKHLYKEGISAESKGDMVAKIDEMHPRKQ